MLKQTSSEFGLIINNKKSAILAIKRHQKLGISREIDGIPVKAEYRYLGIEIDDLGSIDPHL